VLIGDKSCGLGNYLSNSPRTRSIVASMAIRSWIDDPATISGLAETSRAHIDDILNLHIIEEQNIVALQLIPLALS
jgi:hypothetical protein